MTQFHFEYQNRSKNHGINTEQSIYYTLTGELKTKHDNIRYDKGTDCLNYQIKSARATVCKGNDIIAHVNAERADEFIYGTKDGTAYVMNKSEYIEFVETFGTLTRESQKNGGAEKIRLKHETPAMIEWLEARA